MQFLRNLDMHTEEMNATVCPEAALVVTSTQFRAVLPVTVFHLTTVPGRSFVLFSLCLSYRTGVTFSITFLSIEFSISAIHQPKLERKAKIYLAMKCFVSQPLINYLLVVNRKCRLPFSPTPSEDV